MFLVSGHSKEEITKITRVAANERRLQRCTDCLSVYPVEIEPEWLKPGPDGKLYNLFRKFHGELQEGFIYYVKGFVSLMPKNKAVCLI
jgi:hypothetical protein